MDHEVDMAAPYSRKQGLGQLPFYGHPPVVCGFAAEGYAPTRSILYHYRVDRRQIGFVRFIFEAYEGIAFIETLDAAQGLVLLHVAPGCEAIARQVIRGLQQTVRIECVLTNAGEAVF